MGVALFSVKGSKTGLENIAIFLKILCKLLCLAET